MPTVPTSFVPQVADTGTNQIVPFEATPGQPMQNLAADQEVRMGAASVDAGNVMFRIGSNMQDRLNEAEAKEADVLQQRQSNDILYGENGYFNSRGKDAELRFQQVNDSLAGSANEIMDGLRNDTQRAMFKSAAGRNLELTRARMMEHRNREITKFEIDSSRARAEASVGRAIQGYQFREQVQVAPDGKTIPTGPFNTDLALAIKEVEKVGSSLGYPDNSPQMDELRRGVHTAVTGGVVQRLMADSQYASALTYIKKQQQAGNLDPKQSEDMLAKVTSARKTQMTTELAGSIIDRGTLDTPAGSSNYMIPADGKIVRAADRAWEMTTKSYTPIMAPNDGKVIDVYDDERYGRTMVMEFEDGTHATISGVSKGVGAEVGANLVRGQAIGIPEQGSDGKGHFRYSLERNGRLIDPDAINTLNARSNPEKAIAPNTMNEAMEIARGIADPEVQRGVMGEIRRRFAERDAAKKDSLDRVKYAIENELASGRPVSPQLMAQLPATEQKKILDEQRKETSVEIEFEILKQGWVTKDYLLENRDKMTPQFFIEQWKRLDTINSSEAQISADQINQYFIKNGMSEYVNPSKSDKVNFERALELRNKIEARIRATEGSEGMGRRMTWDEKQKMLDDMMLDKARTGGWFGYWGDENPKPTWLLTPSEQERAFVYVDNHKVRLSEIPKEFQQDFTKKLMKERVKYGRYPTMEDIATSWVLEGRPSSWTPRDNNR